EIGNNIERDAAVRSVHVDNASGKVDGIRGADPAGHQPGTVRRDRFDMHVGFVAEFQATTRGVVVDLDWLAVTLVAPPARCRGHIAERNGYASLDRRGFPGARRLS